MGRGKGRGKGKGTYTVERWTLLLLMMMALLWMLLIRTFCDNAGEVVVTVVVGCENGVGLGSLGFGIGIGIWWTICGVAARVLPGVRMTLLRK